MKLAAFTQIANALSDQNRVRAVMALRKGELCMCQIIGLLSLAPSTISKHMSILKAAGIVDSRKDGKWVYYRLSDKNADTEHIQMIISLAIELLKRDETIRLDTDNITAIVQNDSDSVCK